ncbi:MAG: amino acid adenylation domain-containing protein, partial [Nitrosomonas sp.]|nr:amino acid adenylation domain-containing protein [Nitrosomonas sp.]
PLNANGKVDRALLPEPEFHGADEYEAPEGEAEQALTQIWQDVLGLERIGRNANFFELGGDSILSLQIVTKAHRLGWKITPRQLFERQTVAALAQCAEPDLLDIAAESPVQTERLADYLDAQAIAALPFGDDAIEDIYPLSPTQEGMLFHSLEALGSGLYVNQISVAVDGLDVERLISAWQQMIIRHPILRTGFLWRAGFARPLQVVFKQADSQVMQLDWREKEDLDSQVIAYADEELRREFNFEDPPIRLSLIRTAENRHQLVWTKHHILLDGWGDSILISDWLRCYNGEVLAPPGPDYSVYIRWLARQDKKAAQHFWQAELSHIDGPTFLSKAINNPSHTGSGFAQVYTRLSPDETRRLQAFAQHLHITLNTFVQAVWALLLQRYTGKQTIIFGATVAGRPPSLLRADEILGLFINTIPIPVERCSELTVAEYLNALQEKNARLRDYEHTSLADIQRWAGYSGQPLFDSIIVFENYPINAALQDEDRYGLRFGEIAGKGLTGYAMDLQVVIGDALEIEYSYGCSDFSDDFVLNLRSQMEGLMREMMMHPERVVGELGWLGEQTLDELLLLRSDEAFSIRQHHDFVHQQIETNAAQRPDAIALLMGEQEISYAELNTRANQLAHRLIALGAAPEMRIGVAMERSLDVIVTLLAILKSGAAYVPLDMDYPDDRLMFMINDSAVALLLTQQQVLAKHAFDDAVTKLMLDTIDLSAEPVTNPAVAMHEHHLAYVIYTSGSTGLPKGVGVAHGPLAMHCQATARIYGMKPSSCELLFMSFSFDGAHERWLTALTVGAGLAVRDQELWTAEQTYDALHQYEITNAAFPPAYLGQVAEWASSRTDPPPVELYVFGGEAMPKASYDLVRQTLQPRILINGYGPTETVVTPLIWKTEASLSFDCAYAPIGRPVGERVVYVLDVDMQPVPIGVVGELYIGGYGLARGYLGRAGLTAERFIADPFDKHGGRLYRTGDLVRWMENGNIEYIGRADQQVKIRGFRIELGEIEACIRTADSVADAAVVVHHGVSGVQLAAYVVPVDLQQEQAMRVELKQMLAQRLPEYMLPSYIISLSELPRLPSGKLDRKRLPEPEADAGDHYQAPSTVEAQALAEIWQDVLGVERVGETDNFFALGGDSLSSLKVIARIRNLTGLKLELKLRDLLQRPTIAGLLGLEKNSTHDRHGLVRLNQPNGNSKAQPPLFCIHAGLGTVFDYQPLARQLQGIRTVHAIPCRMLADPSHSDVSLPQMAQDYCHLIRTIQPQGPYYLAGWSLGGTLVALMAGILEACGENVAFLGLIDPYIPGTEPMLTGDWRQDFSDFIAVAIPAVSSDDLERILSYERCQTTEPTKQMLNMLLEQVLAIRVEHLRMDADVKTAGYAEMGAEELANIFLTARHLKALSLRTEMLTPLTSRSTCWWAAERAVEERLALEQQIGSGTVDFIELDSDHFSIVRAQSLLSDMKLLLSTGEMDCASKESIRV